MLRSRGTPSIGEWLSVAFGIMVVGLLSYGVLRSWLLQHGAPAWVAGWGLEVGLALLVGVAFALYSTWLAKCASAPIAPGHDEAAEPDKKR